jgi:predicted phage terminase large subunit-like protein
MSSEIELPKLIERLMTIALENAGADRGLLILPAEDDYLIQAEAKAAGDQVEVVLCQKQISGITCPESLVRWGQTSSDIWIEAWCDLVKKWRPSFWAEEHGQIISGVGPFLERRAIERHAYTHREQFPSRGDKAVRAQSMRGRMAMLGLYVRQGAPWFADLRAELLSFPAGRHDDQVDALGLVGQLLEKISPRQPLKPLDLTPRDGYRAPVERNTQRQLAAYPV